jgi:predicted flap endonuclease-1-like 5' DNA nuclease
MQNFPHPWLWLFSALLVGFIAHWLLDLFALRDHWRQLETRLRRKTEEHDSERYAHGRTLADLKARTAELEAARKAVAQSEALASGLAAARDDAAAAVAASAREIEALRAARDAANARAEAGSAAMAELERIVDSVREESSAASLKAIGEVAVARRREEEAADEVRRVEAELIDARLRIESLATAVESARGAADAALAQSSLREAEATAALECSRASASEAATAREALAFERSRRAALEDALAAAQGELADAERRLKVRSDEVRQFSVHLGEAQEALVERGERLLHAEANLEAARQTRAKLEAELASAEGTIASLRAQLESVAPPAPSVVPAAPPDAGLLDELAAMTRDRNALAAELAALRAEQPPAKTGAHRGSRRAASVAPEPEPVREAQGLFPLEEVEPAPWVSPAPEVLTRIAGIDEAFEKRLYAAGVGSCWQVAQMSDADLAAAWDPSAPAPSPEFWHELRAAALARAKAVGGMGRRWNGETPDDFTLIDGLPAAAAHLLHEAGVATFASLAEQTPETLGDICGGALRRPADFAAWISGARALADADGAAEADA